MSRRLDQLSVFSQRACQEHVPGAGGKGLETTDIRGHVRETKGGCEAERRRY